MVSVCYFVRVPSTGLQAVKIFYDVKMLEGVGRFITALPVQHFQFWDGNYAFVGKRAPGSNECDLIGVG